MNKRSLQVVSGRYSNTRVIARDVVNGKTRKRNYKYVTWSTVNRLNWISSRFKTSIMVSQTSMDAFIKEE